MRRITCSWCAQEHTPRFLCDPAAELLRGITAEAALVTDRADHAIRTAAAQRGG